MYNRLYRRYNLNDKECEIWNEGLATRTIAKKCKCMLKIYVCMTLVEPGNAALSQECLHVDKASCERRERTDYQTKDRVRWN